MKLDEDEVKVIKDWVHQGISIRSIASAITLCRLLYINIDAFAAMRSTAQTAIEELYNATNTIWPGQRTDSSRR
jgi:hypothetical protein